KDSSIEMRARRKGGKFAATLLVALFLLTGASSGQHDCLHGAVYKEYACMFLNDDVTLRCQMNDECVDFTEVEESTNNILMLFLYGSITAFLVCCAGMMSGLTIGLMSLDMMQLHVLQNSGTPRERKYAASIIPVV